MNGDAKNTFLLFNLNKNLLETIFQKGIDFDDIISLCGSNNQFAEQYLLKEKKYIIYFKLPTKSKFSFLLKRLRHILEYIDLCFTKCGVVLRGVDKNHYSIVNITIHKSFFIDYFCELYERHVVSIPINDLCEKLDLNRYCQFFIFGIDAQKNNVCVFSELNLQVKWKFQRYNHNAEKIYKIKEPFNNSVHIPMNRIFIKNLKLFTRDNGKLYRLEMRTNKTDKKLIIYSQKYRECKWELSDIPVHTDVVGVFSQKLFNRYLELFECDAMTLILTSGYPIIMKSEKFDPNIKVKCLICPFKG